MRVSFFRLTLGLDFYVLSPLDPDPVCGRIRSGDQPLFCGHGHFFFQVFGPVKLYGAVSGPDRLFPGVVHSLWLFPAKVRHSSKQICFGLLKT
jgi:hypothetical protein